MKIDTNSYLQFALRSQTPLESADSDENVPYSNNIQDLQNINKTSSSVNTNKITDEEKKFFADMYPEKKNEIINYQFYQRDGKVSSVAIGSTFDKKG